MKSPLRLLPLFCIAVVALLPDVGHAGVLNVATLHPILAELATKIGGDHVEVVNVLKRGADPHDFSPAPSDFSRLAASNIVLAMGKNLEPFLNKLRDNLGPDQILIEVGQTIPSLTIREDNELFLHSPSHSVGATDPHWWHSIGNMRRASRIVASAFAKADPKHAAEYHIGARDYNRSLDDLENWAKARIARIPRKDRVLATAHLAFGYLCRDFGFRAIGIRGLTPDHEATAQNLEAAIDILEKEKVRAIFPDTGTNPKILARIAKDAGVRIGGSLDAAGNATGDPVTYEAVVRHNVDTIVRGLE